MGLISTQIISINFLLQFLFIKEYELLAGSIVAYLNINLSYIKIKLQITYLFGLILILFSIFI